MFALTVQVSFIRCFVTLIAGSINLAYDETCLLDSKWRNTSPGARPPTSARPEESKHIWISSVNIVAIASAAAPARGAGGTQQQVIDESVMHRLVWAIADQNQQQKSKDARSATATQQYSGSISSVRTESACCAQIRPPISSRNRPYHYSA